MFSQASGMAVLSGAVLSSRFLCPRPPFLLCAQNQNRHATQAILSSFRLRVVPHFSSGIVERAKRECAWKSPHARKGDTRLRFARSTILEEKWGTVFVVYSPLPWAEITCSRSPWLKRKTRDCSQFTVHPEQQSFCRTGVAKRWIDTGYFSPACIVSPGTVPLY